MIVFLSKRLAQAVLILFGVTLITFYLSFLMPADPVRMLAGRSATQATVESIRKQLGLDQPVPVQYVRYVSRLVRGDLGRSYKQKTAVNELIRSRLPATLLLLVGAIFFELLIGLTAGIVAATKRGRPLDTWIMTFPLPESLSPNSYWDCCSYICLRTSFPFFPWADSEN